MPYIGKKPADIIATVIDTTTGTFSGEVDAGSLDVSGNADIDGITNLDNTDIDGTLNVQGETTLQTHLNMGDNDIIKLGDSADLQIYHDSTRSYIEEGGLGGLWISTNGTEIKLKQGGGADEEMLVATPNGSVDLYWNNQPKFSTTNTGINVTGTATMDGLTVDGDGTLQSSSGSTLTLKSTASSAGQNQLVGGIDFFNSDSSGDGPQVVGSLRTYTKGSTGYGGYIDIGTSTGLTGSESADTIKRLQIDADGDISFYEDTGTTAKFFWNATTESLGIGDTTPENTLTVVETQGNTAVIKARTTAVNGRAAYQIGNDADNWFMGIDGGNSDAFFISDAADSSDRLVITGSGNVGIGTTSPSSALHLSGASTANARQTFTQTTAGLSGQIQQGSTGFALSALGNQDMVFDTNGTERMRIDNDGNVGIGAVPNTSIDTLRTLQIGNGGSIMSHISSTNSLYASSNAYYASGWKYINAGTATEYKAINGEHVWSNASSGSANGAITWSERMRISSGGDISFYEDTGATPKFFWDASEERLGIGTVNPNVNLEIGGTATPAIRLQESGAGAKRLELSIDNTSVGRIKANQSGGTLAFDTLSTERMRISSGGDISFYEDTGTTPKLFWDASEERLGIGTSSPDETLDVRGTFNFLTSENLVAANTTGTNDITIGTGVINGALIIVSGYGNVGTGNIAGMWLIGGFGNTAATTLIVELANTVTNTGSMSLAFQSSGVVRLTVQNTNSSQVKFYGLTVIRLKP